MTRRVVAGFVLTLGGGLLMSSAVVAQGRGANPTGKPFVEVEGQIIEVEGELASLQDQIDSIVARVDTIEERVEADGVAIADLIATNAVMQAQIDTNADDVVSLSLDIDALEAENADLQAQIDANVGDIEALAAQIAYNEGLIAAMQQAVSELGTTLQDQIDNNLALINGLQSEIDLLNDLLALKALLDNEECPNGGVMQEIQADGTLVCADTGGATGLDFVYLVRQVDLDPNQHTSLTVWCPSGYTVTGGSSGSAWGGAWWEHPVAPVGWRGFFKNTQSYRGFAIAYAVCVRLTN